MSEYQYYEFAAIDRPLTRTEMAELRAVSTRATSTPVSFTNYYAWGDLKADPSAWMRRYFDAFIYTANWCSCRLALRVPLATFRKSDLKSFASKYTLTIDASTEYWVFNWSLEDSSNYERFSEDDGSGWMRRLAPLRDALLGGDFRPLYLGWLAGAGMMPESAKEPEVPPGLADLTAAQQALVEFLEIDPDLLAAACAGSVPLSAGASQDQHLDTWLATWSEDEARSVLRRIVTGQERLAENRVKSHYADWLKAQRSPGLSNKTRRTLAELFALAEPIAAARKKQKAQAIRKQQAEHRQRREDYLRQMMGKVKTHWKTADALAVKGVASAYEQLVKLLVELAEGYTLTKSRAAFERDLQRFLAPHGGRRALLQRLTAAGLWPEK